MNAKQPKRILIVGATSAIAQAMAHRFTARGDRICLAARNDTKLDRIAKELRLRTPGCSVICMHHDATWAEGQNLAQEALLTSATRAMGGLDIVLIAHGMLPDPDLCASSTTATLEALQINGLSVVGLMTIAVQRFQKQGHGTLAVISSVAGDRGRASNYVYGAAKAMIDAFASGMGQKLKGTKIRVVNIKPGFVVTPMTMGLKKPPFWITPEGVANRAMRGISKGSPVVYAPGVLRLFMGVLRNVPDRMYRLMTL